MPRALLLFSRPARAALVSTLAIVACADAPERSLAPEGPTSALGSALAYGSDGRWDPSLIDGEVPAVSVALMHDGRILYWSGYEAAPHPDDGSLAHLLDAEFFTGHPHEADTRVLSVTAAGAKVRIPKNPLGVRPGDLFCSAHTLLADGRVLAVGGTDWSPVLVDGQWTFYYGLKYSQFFSPTETAWSAGPDMSAERWYPSLIELGNGDAFVASGLVVGGTSQMQTALERYDAASSTWRKIGDNSFPMYPRLTLVPSGPLKGKVFYSTNGHLWAPSGIDAREATWSFMQACDPAAGTCRLLLPSILGARHNGASVLLPLSAADGYRASVLTFGGTLHPTAVATPATERVDLSTDPPTPRLTAPLGHPRWLPNAVLLPDSTVLAIGGTLVDNVTVFGQPTVHVLEAEQYDPLTDTWRTLAPMQVPRGYHATAILLPDGRVLVGGHVTVPFPSALVRETVPAEQQIVERRLEIYEPPYLHRGKRPSIDGAPSELAYGSSFELRITAESPVESVVLVRPAATTHGYDSSQRVVSLSFTQSGSQVTAVAPPDGDVAPPGYWMLFVNRASAAGRIPSKASFVKLH